MLKRFSKAHDQWRPWRTGGGSSREAADLQHSQKLNAEKKKLMLFYSSVIVRQCIFVFHHNFQSFLFLNLFWQHFVLFTLFFFFFFFRYNCQNMTFLKNKTLTRRFFNAIGAADFAAQNFTCDKI